jgi:5-methylcytosine-specific restriction endonuclease McrA
MPWSKEKRNEYQREWIKKNPEKAREIRKKHNQLPSAKEYIKNYRKEHPPKNPPKRRKGVYNKKYYEKNRDKILAINRKYHRLHPEKNRLYVKIARARRYDSRGTHTLGEWERLKSQYGYTCPCCHRKEPEITLTEDHIIPLSIGGFNSIQNIQPLCKSCNSKKHTEIKVYPI